MLFIDRKELGSNTLKLCLKDFDLLIVEKINFGIGRIQKLSLFRVYKHRSNWMKVTILHRKQNENKATQDY